MSVTKTYVIKSKILGTNHKDIAIVSSGNKLAAITKFILHMQMSGLQKEFNSYDHHFEYNETENAYYNKDTTLRLKIKQINVHNQDFILI